MTERVPPVIERQSRLLGAAAVWRLGPPLEASGLRLPASTPPLRRRRRALGDTATRYIGTVLTVPAGVPLNIFRRVHAESRHIVWPLLWDGVFADPGAPHSLPLILRLPPGDGRSLPTLAALEEVGAALLYQAYGDDSRQRAGGPDGYMLRIGGPVPEATVRSADSVAGTDWKPDPRLTAGRGRHPLAIVAVIDDGLPFAHRGLRDASGAHSRVEFCWMQGAAAPEGAPLPASTPLSGREWPRPAIETLVADHANDEDALYAAAGCFDLTYGVGTNLQRLATHGAHVLGMAAGATDPAIDPERLRIIGVSLAPRVTLNTTGEESEPAILQAFHYVLQRSDQLEAAYGVQDLPLVINFSYGYTGGPHDGSGSLARGLRALIDARNDRGKPTTLVVPAGNTFQAQLNGAIGHEAGGPLDATVRWHVPPSDRSGSAMELWLASGDDPGALDLTLTDPGGYATMVRPPGGLDDPQAQFVLRDRFQAEVGRIWRIATPTRQGLAIHLLPTATPPGAAEAPAGLWRVQVRTVNGQKLSGPVACRIARDFNPIGYFVGARQSTFQPDEPRLDDTGALIVTDDPAGFIRRFGTLNDLATGAPHTLVMGAREGQPGRPSAYSSAGDAKGGAPAVDGSTVSDDGPALPGRLGAATRSGAMARLNGTSVAAPIAAGRVAVASALRRQREDAGEKQPDPTHASPAARFGPVLADEIPALRPWRPEDRGPLAQSGRFLLDEEPPPAGSV